MSDDLIKGIQQIKDELQPFAEAVFNSMDNLLEIIIDAHQAYGATPSCCATHN